MEEQGNKERTQDLLVQFDQAQLCPQNNIDKDNQSEKRKIAKNYNKK